ncbi:MAG TPA: hypothetical protein VJT84_09435 [Gaiellaceae bacterium]|nr:hypothetical protein [Gaiellaceae bacterium]
MDTELQTTYTRGKVLKRAGIGVAAISAVPFFASSAAAGDVGTAAFNKKNCADLSDLANPKACVQTKVCGDKNGLTCFCYVQAVPRKLQSTGCCTCNGNIFCGDSPPCGSPGQSCPSGWKCTFNNCGQTCVPPCGQGIAVGASGGKTAAG